MFLILAFGAAPTTPAFGQPQQTQGFGGFGAPANSAFQSAPAFGQSAPAAPSFGFGAAAPASSGFSFGGEF